MQTQATNHDDVIKWKHFPRYWPFVRGIHRSPVNSPHKGQWRGALMISLICALNKRLSKQSRSWRFETSSRPLWRHCNMVGQRVEFIISSHVLTNEKLFLIHYQANSSYTSLSKSHHPPMLLFTQQTTHWDTCLPIHNIFVDNVYVMLLVPEQLWRPVVRGLGTSKPTQKIDEARQGCLKQTCRVNLESRE